MFSDMDPRPWWQDLDGEAEERLRAAEHILPFGVDYLDDSLGGIRKYDLVVLTGRTSGGKTELASHIAMSNAMNGKRVLMFDLEAEPREIARRIKFKELSKLYRDNNMARLFSGRQPDFADWMNGLQEDMLAPLYPIVDERLRSVGSNLHLHGSSDTFGAEQFASQVAMLRYDYDLVILDHLHYLNFEDDNENRAMGQIMRTIRSTVLHHGVPVILVAHIRKGDRHNPTLVPSLEDVHGSSDIAKVATKVISLARGDATEDPTVFSTYCQAGKYRFRGAVMRYVARLRFDIRMNSFRPGYSLGIAKHDKKREVFAEMPERTPAWVKRGERFQETQDIDEFTAAVDNDNAQTQGQRWYERED